MCRVQHCFLCYQARFEPAWQVREKGLFSIATPQAHSCNIHPMGNQLEEAYVLRLPANHITATKVSFPIGKAMSMETGCGDQVWALHQGNLQAGVWLPTGTLGPFLLAFRNVKHPKLPLLPARTTRVSVLFTAWFNSSLNALPLPPERSGPIQSVGTPSLWAPASSHVPLKAPSYTDISLLFPERQNQNSHLISTILGQNLLENNAIHEYRTKGLMLLLYNCGVQISHAMRSRVCPSCFPILLHPASFLLHLLLSPSLYVSLLLGTFIFLHSQSIFFSLLNTIT